ncbi:arginine repressor [Vallitalea okinawensis]|uniref:hypothetical protein n=1 Tax=Vallitalea okinawensis TaxID=2078660 RepID=UPI000CFBDA97|nr:hypothetical protein [Vallitalea okinawensis]
MKTKTLKEEADNSSALIVERLFNVSETSKRQNAILKLLSANKTVTSQSLIQAHLENIKIYCSQSTISRDIKDLHIETTEEGYYKVNKDFLLSFQEHSLKMTLTESEATLFEDPVTYILSVNPGYERITATKLKETYSDEILGYVCGEGIIILVFNDNDYKEYVEYRIKNLEPLMYKSPPTNTQASNNEDTATNKDANTAKDTSLEN